MVKDVFDTPPQGMARRGKKGWLAPAQTPQVIRTNKLKQENDELKERLAALEEVVMGLSNKKSKK
jgi:cell division protein FtsB